ncbi:hybrid sensor histidine kinase/response regulator transcription factor [Abyssalbus ytuae]|uniref:histidine kinase n=1 Tax=Abyssalbus ytuae TaxID=2926907 RepID=A0A9E7CTE9_9FLAO|nr:two-component regulator propeller domain-containing protein [Abyssalbus ytuae]UOB16047.1 response regulator [Abyssalbus ytuae]
MLVRFFLSALFLILFSFSLLGQERVNFFHITPKVENETIIVKNTIQDKLGYIWMSHKDGITKYDGYDFWFYPYETIFKKDRLGDFVQRIEIDQRGRLWVLSNKGFVANRLTNGGFVSYNQKFSSTNTFTPIQTIFTKKDKIWFVSNNGTIFLKDVRSLAIDSITSLKKIDKNSVIRDLEVTKTNDLIMSTYQGTIFKYSLADRILSEIKGPFNAYRGILVITLDKNDDLWIGTENLGLFHFDLKKESIIEHSFFKNKQNRLIHDRILSLFCDTSGVVWAGSDGEGLYKINLKTEIIKLFKNNLSDKFSLSTNSIIDINEDSYHNLWVVTNYGDLNILPTYKNQIFYHQGSAKKVPVRVLTMLKSFDGTLWIGTDGNGLTKVPPYNKAETQVLTYEDSNEGFYIQALEEDEDKNIWIGTYKNGLWFYNYKKETFSKIEIINDQGIVATNIQSIFKDSKNRIWVGSNLSVSIFLNTQNKIVSFSYGEKGLSGDLTRNIIEDSDKNIWIGVDGNNVSGGLFRFEESHTNIQNSKFLEVSGVAYNNKGKLRGVSAMTATADGKLWILNSKGQLLSLNTKNNRFTYFNSFASFNETEFLAILKETDNSLWLSSTQGIWNFNTTDSIVKRYYKTDGFQEDYFIHGSAYKDNLGYLYFGGLYGLNRFHPRMIFKTQRTANINFNDIEIVNKTALSVIPDQIQNGIENVNSLKLKHYQSSFSFRFSVVGNILNSGYFYSYRLKGFDDDWIVSKNERKATYTNIPPGDYTFEVKAGFKKGNWEIPSKSIQVYIAKPFWNQNWAYVVYFILTGLLFYGIYKWILLKNNLLRERIKNNNEKEFYALKMNFFAKMSHEIQTPLSLIKAPIQDMLKRLGNSEAPLLKQRLKIISNSSDRLSRIVYELTTVRNKELGQLRLKVYKKDIIKVLKDIAEPFEEQARIKDISFHQSFSKEIFDLWIDVDKIEHVLYNLLSNAFKFTPKKGNINFYTKIDSKNNLFEIVVQDSGPGISAHEQENIFKLFYQAHEGKQKKGTGIGLALAKELIELHKGEILLDSHPYEGTKFTVRLPVSETAYSKEEKMIGQLDFVEQVLPYSENSLKLFDDNEKPKEYKKFTLLIVEDNFEMQYFLQDVFSKSYKVLVADNGEEGLELAERNNIDIIISDISMPVMDGLEMCNALQKNKRTSHIPVILLTAIKTTETKIKGLELGAIEYISKPFNIHELILKTYNLLANQEKVFSNFKSELVSSPKTDTTKSKDILFLEKLTEALNKEINNSDFKLEDLSQIFNMSYSVIYRKCQAITGKSIVDFFRLIRLKKSAILLIKKGYTISEVSFIVGFNDPQYFSRCFKKQFGKTPKTFKKEALKADLDIFLKEHGITTTLD